MRVASLVVVALAATGCAADAPPTGATTPVGATTPAAEQGRAGGDGSAPAGAGTLPLAEQALDDPDETTLATDLAPSQISASTVAEPSTPPPCAASDLQVWTARVERAERSVDAVLRMRNDGDGWCEADVGRSPLLDPSIEPDVWLLPGGEADLHVGQRAEDCAEPTFVPTVQIGIGTESVLVPSFVVSCGWWLDAFVPLEPPASTCSDLEAAVVGSAVVLRTRQGACIVSSVVDAAGAELLPRDAAAPVVASLQPGDVATIGRVAACDTTPPGTVTVGFADAELTLTDAPCGLEIRAGPPAPWFGGPDGPAAAVDRVDGADETDEREAAVAAATDPFG